MTHVPQKEKPIKGSQSRPRTRRAPPELKFFDEQQYQGARGLSNDVDIWVDTAQLYVRLTPRWRKSVTDAANRFRTFRGPTRDAAMVLQYHDKFCTDVLVVSRRQLVENKGNRIAIHDGERDIFVLLPEEFSREIVTEALRERKECDAAAASKEVATFDELFGSDS